ncbi:MAG: hypothetical protein WED09_03835 [Homoserinimonas sp.]
MSDPIEPQNSSDPRVEDQDGAVTDAAESDAQQDTVSGGAPDEPDTPDDVEDAESPENSGR